MSGTCEPSAISMYDYSNIMTIDAINSAIV